MRILRKVTRGNEVGLSLIEILIVITIVSILVALALPALRGSVERAKTAKCTNHLRQLHQGVLAYAADNQNSIPAVATTDLWHRKIWPYIHSSATEAQWPTTGAGTAGVYLCPSDHDSVNPGISYAMNQNVYGKKLLSSARILLLMDFNTYGASGSAANLDARLKGRHAHRDNFLFQDGHVETRNRSDVPSRDQDPALWGL